VHVGPGCGGHAGSWAVDRWPRSVLDQTKADSTSAWISRGSCAIAKRSPVKPPDCRASPWTTLRVGETVGWRIDRVKDSILMAEPAVFPPVSRSLSGDMRRELVEGCDPPGMTPTEDIWVRRIALGFLMLLITLAVTGLIYQAVATQNDRQEFSPPGQLVAVDGYQLHINCTGEGVQP
jgi:hypothetical protein